MVGGSERREIGLQEHLDGLVRDCPALVLLPPLLLRRGDSLGSRFLGTGRQGWPRCFSKQIYILIFTGETSIWRLSHRLVYNALLNYNQTPACL